MPQPIRVAITLVTLALMWWAFALLVSACPIPNHPTDGDPDFVQGVCNHTSHVTDPVTMQTITDCIE